MRNTIGCLILLSALISSCGSKDSNSAEEAEAEVVVDSSPDSQAVKVAKNPESTDHKNDSASVDSFKSKKPILADSITTSFGVMKQELLSQHKVTDSVDYIIFSRFHGVCTEYFVATVVADTLFKEADIGDACDHEQGIPNNSWVEQVADDTTGLYWLQIESYVQDSFLNDQGEIKEGFTLKTWLRNTIPL